MAFNANEFKIKRLSKGYETNEAFLQAYNNHCGKMSEPAFYNKLTGKSDWKRNEISNVAELLEMSFSDLQKIFFYTNDTV